MKKLSRIFLALTLALTMSLSMLTFAACGRADGLINPNELRMAHSLNFPPFGSTLAGNNVGVDIRIGEELAERMGVELVIQHMPHATSLLAVQNGQIDIALNTVTVTEARRNVMYFSRYYFNSGVVLLQNDRVAQALGVYLTNDMTREEIMDRVQGRNIVGSGTNSPFLWGQANLNANMLGYDSTAMALARLASPHNNDTPFAIVNISISDDRAAAEDELTAINVVLADEMYGIAIRQGNSTLRDKINEHLEDMIEDGTLAEILADFGFSADLIPE